MDDDEYEVTIGTGGWVLVVLSGAVTFVALWFMAFVPFAAAAFALAIALAVLLLLYWLAGKVSAEEETAARRVRKIVPASAEVRLDGVAAPAVKAVPVRPESLRSRAGSSVVTPLSELSVQLGSVPVRFPDFTRGRWKEPRKQGVMVHP